MGRAISQKFYQSARWKKCRKSFVEMRRIIDGGLCERCKVAPGYIVHHKEELNEYNFSNPEVSLNHSKLEYVCIECHNMIHKGKNFLLCRFDENGQPTPLQSDVV